MTETPKAAPPLNKTTDEQDAETRRQIGREVAAEHRAPLLVEAPPPPLTVGVPPAASMTAACASRSLSEGFDAGWRVCAKWAKRADLLADMDSPAYAKDREAALNGDCAATRVPGQAEHGTAGIAQTGYASSARREPELGGSECGDGRRAGFKDSHGSDSLRHDLKHTPDAGNSRSTSEGSEPEPCIDRKRLRTAICECLLHFENEGDISTEQMNETADEYLPDFLAILQANGSAPPGANLPAVQTRTHAAEKLK